MIKIVQARFILFVVFIVMSASLKCADKVNVEVESKSNPLTTTEVGKKGNVTVVTVDSKNSPITAVAIGREANANISVSAIAGGKDKCKKPISPTKGNIGTSVSVSGNPCPEGESNVIIKK